MSKKQECPAETTFPQQNSRKYPLGSNSALKTCILACFPDFVSFLSPYIRVNHYCQSKRNEWPTRTPTPSAPISAFPTSSTLRILGANRLFVGHYWLLHSATDCSSGGCKKFARAVKVGARLSKTRLWGWFRCKKSATCPTTTGLEKVRGGSAKSGRCYYTLSTASDISQAVLYSQGLLATFQNLSLDEDMCATAGACQRQAIFTASWDWDDSQMIPQCGPWGQFWQADVSLSKCVKVSPWKCVKACLRRW